MFTILAKSAAVSRIVALFVAAAVVALLLLPQPAAATNVSLPGCTRQCGSISIPHPFGVEPWCYLPGFNVTCRNDSDGSPKLFLGDGTVEVLEISIANATARINATFAYFPGTNTRSTNPFGAKPIASGTWSGALGKGGVYTASPERNRMFVAGCNILVKLVGDRDDTADRRRPTLSTCVALCDWDEEDHTWYWYTVKAASPIPYCEANIKMGRSSYGFEGLGMKVTSGTGAAAGGSTDKSTEGFAWILDSRISFEGNNQAPELTTFPAVLDWRINHTTCYGNSSSAACRSSHSSCQNDTDDGTRQAHICSCAQGYQGNPYIPNGCKDVDECVSPETYSCYGVCINTEGGHQCKCPLGFAGNASLPNGCKDIDECAHPDHYSCYGDCKNRHGTFQCQCKHGTYGDPFTKGGCISSTSVLTISLGVTGGTILLLLVLGVPFIIRKIKKHKVKRMKERFFKQNHGLLLQQLVSQQSDIGGRMIITLRELEKATNNFDPSHKIGGGRHGIVYKGLLDLQVVAIKKSKIIVQKEIDDFINEVAILSQINHRNIVKLLGCCLETEVPLLVYEFISNGTLAHHLHVEGNISLPWDDRMRIALETSRALAYLHSAASTPVLHRDIKSSNILLDDNLIAKVSDFGASRYISIDQTGVTTAIQGTIGYLDPMYCYTSRLTEKSDVFSFGVLLIELLTRKRPTMRTSGGDSLVSHFASLIAEGDLIGIIDPQIMEEAEVGKVKEVAKLAAMCTKLNGEGRPTMREVEMTLENLRITKHTHQNTERDEKDQNVGPYISFEGFTIEASRQYTMEEEILLSNTYPR